MSLISFCTEVGAMIMLKLTITALFVVAVGTGPTSAMKTTAQRIARYNYPVETHKVQTSDGYILTVFRIPYSPKLKNQNKRKPVAFLNHGLLSSSDCWIPNGPDNALAFLLSDAGYDVWLGNNRGNTYSKKHVKISSLRPSFWDFTWNEIALLDLPAQIDYVLFHTNEQALHYVGHSQGTTIFFVLMSEMPKYNAKIKTAHMLAPVVYVEHMTSPFAKMMGPMLGQPSLLTEMMGNSEFMPSNKFMSMMGQQACKDTSSFQPMCGNVLFLMAGWNSQHLNNSLLSEVCETHPAGASTGQLLHYLQEYVSGMWRRYDYGKLKNNRKYSSWSPPKYNEKNVVAPVRLYYSDNDYFSSVVDVHKLMRLLPNLVESFHVPYPTFNHLDFLFGMEVKPLLYDRIIAAANRFERTGKQ
ncbi:lipase 3-like [Eupeodes corollae]|uniref:lipase 3-like n=1 Tax=Eupeodes corollae TaxID=290404 RepID=UPI0024935B80|nr:lipase 3-like [Eupeodes corollae]